MSGNLFTDVYAVKERMFEECEKNTEIALVRRQVADDIKTGKKPNKLHYLMFKMTNRCNSDCEYCPHAISRGKYEEKNDISKEIIIQTIREAAELGTTAVAVNGGEPLMRSDIYEIIKEIIDNKMVPVLMTNGLLLPKMWERLGKTGLKYVIISFDSLVKDVYEKQRGCSFENAMKGIDAAVEMMNKYPGAEVHVSAVLTKDNQDDFIGLIKYMSDRGIKIHVSPFHNYLQIREELNITKIEKIQGIVEQMLELKRNGYLIASASGFIKHLEEFFINDRRIPKDYSCKIGYTNLFIDAYMNVRPCWSEHMGIVGKLGENSLREIWNSDRMQECRKKMLRNECEGCWYMCTGEVTMMLDDMLD